VPVLRVSNFDHDERHKKVDIEGDVIANEVKVVTTRVASLLAMTILLIKPFTIITAKL
jgi:hypothetical protein